ncbi:hypothetical protein DSOL_3785 [Desulfosporosinus metallidurans]|uniref:RdRp catalytic domain-containing protein n=1 Tax=Desulfosporosinus metallidurans TaxID=1888891 RepID=A0A1Q8QNS1_9FIRM|nr:hypothetical protein DSOL_3785 [Desulfosporosinus metallidurans]
MEGQTGKMWNLKVKNSVKLKFQRTQISLSEVIYFENQIILAML